MRGAALRRVVGWAVVATAFALPESLGRAEPPAGPGEPALVASLERARGMLAAGKAEEGLKIVRQALVAHVDQDYARAKRVEIEDLVHRLAFAAEVGGADPQSVVKGKLKRFVSKTGDVDLQYDAGAETDFTKDKDGSLEFPARFKGPLTVVVKGERYPRTSEASPAMYFGFEEDPKTRVRHVYTVLFGVPEYEDHGKQYWLPAKIIHKEGEEKTTLFEKEICPAKVGAPYRLEMKVTGNRIQTSINAQPLGSAPRKDGAWGYLAIDVPDWTEIDVTGQIEPSWIQGRLDKIVQAKRLEFDKAYDPHERLPEWLFQPGTGGSPSPSGGTRPGSPPQGSPSTSSLASDLRSMPPGLLANYLAGVQAVASEEYAKGLSICDDLRQAGAPEAAVAILEAGAQLGMGDFTKALAAVDKALASKPASVEALTVKARILRTLGRDDEALAMLRAIGSSPDADARTFEQAIKELLFAGRPEDARVLAKEAAKRGFRTRLLEAESRLLVKAANGPEWGGKSFESKTTNYHVVTDIDLATAQAAGQVLEDALTQFRAQVRATKPEPKRLYRVFLFSGQDGFRRYVAETSVVGGKPPETVVGQYSGLLKQLLIWNVESRVEMMKTIKHEGFHQYLDRVLPDPPVWFNEGMASYYEGMDKVAGSLRLDLPRGEYLDCIEKHPLLPMKEYVEQSAKAFYARGFPNYAQGWLVVHLMRHGPSKYRDLFKKMISRLETGGGAEVQADVLDEATLSAFDADLAAHLARIAKPTK
jgi:tetratricopeptide (TPR) repeat protein